MLRDPYQNRTKTKLKTKLLALDASIDTAVYYFWGMLGRFIDTSNSFMRRFSVNGWKFWLVQALSGGLTMAVFGSIFALSLAISNFELTENGLPAQEDYAVTFLDRFGNEIGKRGILQDDSFELQDLPDHFIKAVWQPRIEGSSNISESTFLV